MSVGATTPARGREVERAPRRRKTEARPAALPLVKAAKACLTSFSQSRPRPFPFPSSGKHRRR